MNISETFKMTIFPEKHDLSYSKNETSCIEMVSIINRDLFVQDLVTFVHRQADILMEKSITIEKQSETIGILSASMQRLKEDNLVRFSLYSSDSVPNFCNELNTMISEQRMVFDTEK